MKSCYRVACRDEFGRSWTFTVTAANKVGAERVLAVLRPGWGIDGVKFMHNDDHPMEAVVRRKRYG